MKYFKGVGLLLASFIPPQAFSSPPVMELTTADALYHFSLECEAQGKKTYLQGNQSQALPVSVAKKIYKQSLSRATRGHFLVSLAYPDLSKKAILEDLADNRKDHITQALERGDFTCR